MSMRRKTTINFSYNWCKKENMLAMRFIIQSLHTWPVSCLGQQERFFFQFNKKISEFLIDNIFTRPYTTNTIFLVSSKCSRWAWRMISLQEWWDLVIGTISSVWAVFIYFSEEESYKQLENNNGHSIQTYFTDEQFLINHYNISDDDDLPSSSHSH